MKLTGLIKNELILKGFTYLTAPYQENSLVVNLLIDNMKLEMYIFVYDNKVNFQIVMPLTVEPYMKPLISMWLCEHNNSAFSKRFLNLESGEVFYDYSYLVNSDTFNKYYFWIYFRSMTSEACKTYNDLNRLAMGFIESEEKSRYVALLNETISELMEE